MPRAKKTQAIDAGLLMGMWEAEVKELRSQMEQLQKMHDMELERLEYRHRDMIGRHVEKQRESEEHSKAMEGELMAMIRHLETERNKDLWSIKDAQRQSLLHTYVSSQTESKS